MGIELAAAVFAFIAVSGAALSVFRYGPVPRSVERRLEVLNRVSVPEGPEVEGVLKRGPTSLPLLRRLLSNTRWAGRAALDLQQAGLRLRASEYFLLRLLTAAVAALVILFLTQASTMGVFIASGAAVIGFMVPAWYVHVQKGRRQAAINGQLVEMLQLISNALRSGFAFTQAVEMAAGQLPPPMRDELNHFLRDNALGARTDDALQAIVKRTGSMDLEMVVTTIIVQRTTGGNLSEILDNVAETIRERERLHGQIRALTAQQRLTGTILSVYPIFLGMLFVLLAPDLMKVLWEEPLGRMFLLAAAILQVLGALTIRRILRLDV